ncbi:MAG: DUF4296 domain-containing protein [Cytophagales bacterium]|nr:DUF4296 domain-containing protein [Cytophagales bacterium]
MKKHLWIFFGLAFSLFSCKKLEIPEDVIKQDKMVAIMIDLHIAEEVAQTKGWSYDSARVMFHSVYKLNVLNKHRVKRATFDSSYVFYERNPELMNKMYKVIVDSLSKRVDTKRVR